MFEDLRAQWCRRCAIPPQSGPQRTPHLWLFDGCCSVSSPRLIRPSSWVTHPNVSCLSSRERLHNILLWFVSQPHVFLYVPERCFAPPCCGSVHNRFLQHVLEMGPQLLRFSVSACFKLLLRNTFLWLVSARSLFPSEGTGFW